MPEWDDADPAWSFSVAKAVENERRIAASVRELEEDPEFAARVAEEIEYRAAHRKRFQQE